MGSTHDDILGTAVCNGCGQVDEKSDRRRAQADQEVDHHQDAEVNGGSMPSSVVIATESDKNDQRGCGVEEQTDYKQKIVSSREPPMVSRLILKINSAAFSLIFMSATTTRTRCRSDNDHHLAVPCRRGGKDVQMS